MKKVRTLLAAAIVLMTIFAGQAFAYSSGSLVMALYNEDTSMEKVYDLGSAFAIDDAVLNLTLETVNFADMGDLADIQLGYFATQNSTYDFFYATVQDTSVGVRSAGLMNFMGASAFVYDYDSPAVHSPSDHTSYNITMNSNGTTPGFYAGYIATGMSYLGETNLSDLATVGYVDMYLYHFAGAINLAPGSDPSTDYAGILRLNADGTTVLNPIATPIPASMLLFGSGLLGFVGIRRKNS